jgi:hypothetical protein
MTPQCCMFAGSEPAVSHLHCRAAAPRTLRPLQLPLPRHVWCLTPARRWVSTWTPWTLAAATSAAGNQVSGAQLCWFGTGMAHKTFDLSCACLINFDKQIVHWCAVSQCKSALHGGGCRRPSWQHHGDCGAGGHQCSTGAASSLAEDACHWRAGAVHGARRRHHRMRHQWCPASARPGAWL